MIDPEKMDMGMRVRFIAPSTVMAIVDLPSQHIASANRICTCKWFNPVDGIFHQAAFWNWELEAAE